MSSKKWNPRRFLAGIGGDQDLPLLLRGSRSARLLASGAGFFGLALVLVAGAFVVRGNPAYKAAQLERENQVLAAELEDLRLRLEGLQSAMEELSVKDAEVRTLAGLHPLDAEVLEVGVGGPGTPSLEGHPLYALREDLGSDAFAASWDLNALERRARLLRESLFEAADSLALYRDMMESTPSILPVEGRISSRFSNARFHPIHNRAVPHEGIDVPAPVGTPIVAPARGRVVAAGRQSGYGLRVEIDHGFGITTLFAHASRVMVQVGQEVERGETIAQVGATGLATSPHLHYEVRRHGIPVNPMDFILPGSLP
jgi:murein DD-endopeptidase MepM/ murein hydrolase activator NlpD